MSVAPSADPPRAVVEPVDAAAPRLSRLTPRDLAWAESRIVRWETPRPGEPAHGFLLRLAAKHRDPRAGAFARSIGVENNTLAQDCLAAVMRSRRGTPEDKAALTRWTPVVKGAWVRIGSEVVRRGDWTLATRRFCPACLAEDPYHRVWFDLGFVRTCPIHGVQIHDRLPDGTRVGWARSQLTVTPSGQSIAVRGPRLGELPDTLEAYALGRLGFVDAPPNALLDPAPLGEVIEAAEMMGRLALGGHRTTMPLLGRLGIPEADLQAAGYAYLKGGAAGAASLFLEIASHAPGRTFGARSLFGWAYTGFSFKEDLSIKLRGIMTEVASKLGLNGRRYRPGKEPESTDRLTVREVATVLGADEQAVLNLARSIRAFLPHPGMKGTPHLIAGGKLDEMFDLLIWSVTRTEAASHLGIGLDSLGEIVLAGHVSKIGTRWGQEGLEDRFHTDDLDTILDLIPCQVPWNLGWGGHVSIEPGLITVPEALTLTRQDAGSFLTAVLDGDIRIHSRTGFDRGLADFRLDPSDQPASHPFTKRLRSTVMSRSSNKVEGMTQREACALLDASPRTVKVLTDLGLLGLADGSTPKNRQKMDRASVLAFADRYAAGKLYAGVLGCQDSKVASVLRQRGIVDMLTKERPGTRIERVSPFFDRAELRQLLGLARDPDADDGARVYWKGVATVLAAGKSNFMLWLARTDGTAVFATASREWLFDVRHVHGEDGGGEIPEGARRYVLRAVLTLAGANGGDRAAAVARTASERLLPAPIFVDHDATTGTLTARLDALIQVSSPDPDDDGFAFSDPTHDGAVVQRMLETVKGSLEEGVRPFDGRAFGRWPEMWERVRSPSRA